MAKKEIPILSLATGTTDIREPVEKTVEEWKRTLPPTAFEVTRLRGTEPAFTGAYHAHHGDGVYRCVCCGTDLFDSHDKFESGTGWPSFSSPVARGNIRIVPDHSLGMERHEVLCALCGAHLGHVFDDGPSPSFKRYCINSASLLFLERAKFV